MTSCEEIKVHQYVMVIEKEAEGGLSGSFPDVPGCFTQGETMEELLANAEDALETHFAGLMENGLPVPEPKSRTASIPAKKAV